MEDNTQLPVMAVLEAEVLGLMAVQTVQMDIFLKELLEVARDALLGHLVKQITLYMLVAVAVVMEEMAAPVVAVTVALVVVIPIMVRPVLEAVGVGVAIIGTLVRLAEAESVSSVGDTNYKIKGEKQ